VAATVLEGLLDPVVEVTYCLEQRQIRSQRTSSVVIISMTKCHFYTPKNICGQIMLSCLCPPRATHATTMAFIKLRMNLLFSVKDKTRKTFFSCYFFLAPLLHIRQEYSFLSVQGITFFHQRGREVGASSLARFPPHLQVPLASC